MDNSVEAYVMAAFFGLCGLFLAAFTANEYIVTKGSLNIKLGGLSASFGFLAVAFFLYGRNGDGWPAIQAIGLCSFLGISLFFVSLYWHRPQSGR